MAMTDRWADKQKKKKNMGGGGKCPACPPGAATGYSTCITITMLAHNELPARY